MRRGCIVFIIGILIVSVCACTKSNTVPERLQGRWVDLHSNVSLEIIGNKMDIIFRSSTDHYKIKVESIDDHYVIMNTEEHGGFGIMSSIREISEGRLSAYEMILDDNGHSYEFVREEVKEEELKVKDYSEDLPKTISSDVIVEFSLGFENDGTYGLDESWTHCSYTWEIDREEDGTWMCNYSEMYPSLVGRRYRGEVSEEFMHALHEAILDAGVLPHNGYDMRNNGRQNGYHLNVLYENEEAVSIYAYGDPADTCIFDLPVLMEVIKPLLEDE